jgi:hypothetical protein
MVVLAKRGGAVLPFQSLEVVGHPTGHMELQLEVAIYLQSE